MAFEQSENDRSAVNRLLSRIHDVWGDHLLQLLALYKHLDEKKKTVLDDFFGLDSRYFPACGLTSLTTTETIGDLSPVPHTTSLSNRFHPFFCLPSIGCTSGLILRFVSANLISQRQYPECVMPEGGFHPSSALAPFCFPAGFFFSRSIEYHPSLHRSLPVVWSTQSRSIACLSHYKTSPDPPPSTAPTPAFIPRLDHVSHSSCSRTHRLYHRLPAQRPCFPQSPLYHLPYLFARLQIPPLQ